MLYLQPNKVGMITQCLAKCFVFSLLWTWLPCAAHAQSKLSVVWWNVENLFDTQHDTLHQDQDFLPEGEYHWTPQRYWRKLNDVAKTLVAMGGEDGVPVLVGLCEVENDTVMRDLTRRSALRTACYDYVMTDSPDLRGVDVALLYQTSLFQLLEWHSVRIPSAENGFRPTRDILYAKGRLLSRDTLHVVVCHLPSKQSGSLAADRHRLLATQTLRGVVDSLLTVDPVARLLVMGDFNAESKEGLFAQLLPPLRETLPTGRRVLRRPVGTYYFQRLWSYIDHILVSPSLAAWQSALGHDCRAHEQRLPFLLNKKGVPSRTFLGTHYNGGISDHLPLTLALWYSSE